MLQQTAQLNYLRMAPRKVRSVAMLVKGLSVNEAEAQLLMERRRAAQPILKLLRSAVANAKNNQRIAPDKLYIEAVRVDGGPMLKRFLPRARGMATPIQKKMSHVTLVLREKQDLSQPRFKIVVEKKSKLPREEKRRTLKKEKAVKAETKVTPESKRQGFLRRIFTRKTATG
ncbi:50S ribosomal protein L22 [Candidatus Parcubacteria bacterium]|nr:MAG: 50S ribosomal protein L22 [Candidatus Parcubacteria bacterium]